MAKRTATTKTTIKAPKITQAPRLRVQDLGVSTVDAPTINDTDPEGTVKRNRPPRGFEPQLPENLEERVPAGTTPTTGEDKQTILDNSIGRVDQATALKARLGQDENESGELLPGAIRTDDIPEFDQGFDGKPSGKDLPGEAGDTGETPTVGAAGSDQQGNGTTSGFKPGGIGGTPMDPFRGSSMGGPLSATAQASSGVTGIAQQGNGAISAAPTTVEKIVAGGAAALAVAALIPGAATYAPAGAAGYAVGTFLDIMTDGALSDIGVPKGTDTTRLDLMYEAVSSEASAKASEKSEPKKLPVVVETTTTEYDDQGNPISTKTSATDSPATPPSTGQPIEENPPLKFDIVTTSTLLEQLQAAQAGKPTSQGGGGDATPVEDGGIGGVVRDGFIAPNQSSINSRNLFGQPGGNAIGENVSGGSQGQGLSDPGRPNGPGAINPGPDGGDPAGDPRFAEDPGAALGDGKPGPSFPPASGNDGDDETSTTGNTQEQATDPVTGGTLASGGGLVIADGFQPRTFDAITAFQATQPQPAPGTVPTTKPELVLPQPQTFVSQELFSTAPLIGSVGPTEPTTTQAPFGEPVLTSVFGPSTSLQARTTSTLLLA